MFDELKRRYGFDDWSGRDGRLLYKPLPDLRDRMGLQFESRAALEGERHGFIDYYRAYGGARVAITILQHGAVVDAHEGLLRVLLLVMAPRLASCDEKGLRIGDACFCNNGEVNQTIFFVRANILVRVENAGSQSIDVSDIALEVDRQLQAWDRPSPG